MKMRCRGTIKYLILVLAVIVTAGMMPLPQRAAAGDGTDSTLHKADVVVFVQFKDTAAAKDPAGNEVSNYMAAASNEINYQSTPYVNYSRTQTAVKYFRGDGSLDSPAYSLSFEKYIADISGGRLDAGCFFPQYDTADKVIDAYTAANNKSAYINDEFTLVNEVIDMLNKRSGTAGESSSYDGDGDGVIDDLTIVAAGGGAVDFTAHSTNYEGSRKIGNKSVGCYNLLTYSDIEKNGAGVISHEFLHTLGYPDLYNNAETGTGYPVGVWDIMATAGVYMAYPLAYMRQKISGWVSLDTVAKDGIYTLESMAGNRDRQAVIIKSPMSDNEFFVAEFRRQGSSAPTPEIDAKTGESGVIFYRVNTGYNTNIQGNDFIHVFHRGSDGLTDTAKASYPYKDDSNQTVDSFDGLVFADGTSSGISISDIGDPGGDTISFKVTYPEQYGTDYWKSYAPGKNVNGGTASAVFDGAGNYCTAWEQSSGDAAGHNSIMVSRYDGSSWSSLGTKLDAWGSGPLIKYCGGRLYAAYQQYSSSGESYHPVVKCYDGSGWKEIGGLSETNGDYFTMESDGTSLYLAAASSSAQGSDDICTIYRLDAGGKFKEETSYSEAGVMYSDLCLLPSGDRAFLAYRNGSGSNTIYIKEKTDDGWQDAGSIAGGTGPSLAVNGDRCYLSVSAPAGSKQAVKVYSRALDSSSEEWTAEADLVTGAGTEARLQSYEGTLYGAYSSAAGVSVKRLAGSSWDDVGNRVIGSSVNDFDMNIYRGYCYIGYNLGTAEGEDSHYYVRRLAVTADAAEPADPDKPANPEDDVYYRIAYVLSGGTQNDGNPSAFRDSAGAVLYPPEKRGYLFSGWYLDSAYRTATGMITAGTGHDVTLYARWRPVKYRIVFKKNHGRTGKMQAMKSLKYGKTYKLRKNKFRRSGYRFAGWGMKKSGKGKIYRNKAKIRNLTAVNGKKIVLYARWKKK